MNRRGFFKVLVGATIAPFALPKAKAKIKRNLILDPYKPTLPWKNYYVTYEYQLQNDPLIRVPLKKKHEMAKEEKE